MNLPLALLVGLLLLLQAASLQFLAFSPCSSLLLINTTPSCLTLRGRSVVKYGWICGVVMNCGVLWCCALQSSSWCSLGKKWLLAAAATAPCSYPLWGVAVLTARCSSMHECAACLCELPACLCSRYFHLLKLRFGWFGIIPMWFILLACQVDFAAAQPVILI